MSHRETDLNPFVVEAIKDYAFATSLDLCLDIAKLAATDARFVCLEDPKSDVVEIELTDEERAEAQRLYMKARLDYLSKIRRQALGANAAANPTISASLDSWQHQLEDLGTNTPLDLTSFDIYRYLTGYRKR